MFDGLTQGKGIIEEFLFFPPGTAHRWLIFRNTPSQGNRVQTRFLKKSTTVSQ